MIRLLDQAHSRAVDLLSTGAPVFLPVNPVEYHGPHLSLHNDHLISLGIARELHARLVQSESEDWPLLLGADLEVGVEPACGPGSRFTALGTTRRLVLEACRALRELGAQRVILVTFHGSGLHNVALEAGARYLRRSGVPAIAPMNLLLHEMVNLDPTPYAPAYEHVPNLEDRDAMLRGLDLDFHAGFFETSLSLHYAPDSVAPEHLELPDCPAWPVHRGLAMAARVARGCGSERFGNDLSFIARAIGWMELNPYPGYTGRPRWASPEAGALFASAIIDKFAAETSRVFAGARDTPGPALAWLDKVTLGGRLPQPHVPLDRVGLPHS